MPLPEPDPGSRTTIEYTCKPSIQVRPEFNHSTRSKPVRQELVGSAIASTTGFGFDVAIDQPTSVLGYTGYSMGSIFDDFSDPFNPNNVSGLYFGPGNAGEDIELATLRFEALGVGTGTIDTSGLFDGMFYGLFYMFGDEDLLGSLDVSVNAAPVPEPGTFILLLTGLAGVVGMKKRRR